MQLFRFKSLKWNLVAFSGLVLVGFFAAVTVLFSGSMRSDLWQEKKAMVENLVKSQMGVLEHYHELQQSGALTEKEAKQKAKAFLEQSRYGDRGKGYFWINDMQPAMIMHPYKPQLNGKDLSGVSDPNGVHLFNEMVDTVRSGTGGFVEYSWQYFDNQNRIEPKLSYVQGFSPWGWIVGTGVYVNDVQEMVLGNLYQNTAIGIVIMLFALGAMYFLSQRQTKPIVQAAGFAQKLSSQDLQEDELEIQRQDELGTLARSLSHTAKDIRNRFSFAEGVLQNMPLPCVVGDESNRITFVNQPIIDFIELEGKPEDFHGMSVAEFFYNDPNHPTITGKAYKERREIVGVQTEVTTRKGNTAFAQIDAAPLFDAKGSIIGSFAAFSDLSQLKKQEQEIEKQNERMEQAASEASQISEQLSSSAEELSSQVEQASRGAEEQKKRASEAATAMEEMNSNVIEVSKNASSSAEAAENTKEKAQNGVQSVEKSIELMRQVQEKARGLEQDMSEMQQQADGISEIMTTISDIADQAKLLAGNGASEAARAGESGEGFAVVADEVRKLAEKTMSATQEVGSYIQTIQKSAKSNTESSQAVTQAVNENMELSEQAGQVLKEMLDLAQSTADQVSNIATAAEEQSSASEQINQSTEEVNRIAQETADAMNQSAQAITELSQLAQKLNQTIAQIQKAKEDLQEAKDE